MGVALLSAAASTVAGQQSPAVADRPTVQLRAWGVPDIIAASPAAQMQLGVLSAFRAQYPWIEPVSSTGLQIQGSSRAQDMAPLMQIAGGIAPDVLHVDFRRSHTYFHKKLLYPAVTYASLVVAAIPTMLIFLFCQKLMMRGIIVPSDT